MRSRARKGSSRTCRSSSALCSWSSAINSTTYPWLHSGLYLVLQVPISGLSGGRCRGLPAALVRERPGSLSSSGLPSWGLREHPGRSSELRAFDSFQLPRGLLRQVRSRTHLPHQLSGCQRNRVLHDFSQPARYLFLHPVLTVTVQLYKQHF